MRYEIVTGNILFDYEEQNKYAVCIKKIKDRKVYGIFGIAELRDTFFLNDNGNKEEDVKEKYNDLMDFLLKYIKNKYDKIKDIVYIAN